MTEIQDQWKPYDETYEISPQGLARIRRDCNHTWAGWMLKPKRTTGRTVGYALASGPRRNKRTVDAAKLVHDLYGREIETSPQWMQWVRQVVDARNQKIFKRPRRVRRENIPEYAKPASGKRLGACAGVKWKGITCNVQTRDYRCKKCWRIVLGEEDITGFPPEDYPCSART